MSSIAIWFKTIHFKKRVSKWRACFLGFYLCAKKKKKEWSSLLLRACQKCCLSCGLIVDPNLACCCSLQKPKQTWPLAPFEPFCLIHFVSVSMTACTFTTRLMKLAALSLLIYCSVVFLFVCFLHLCSYFFYKTNVEIEKKVHIKKQMIIVNIVCSVLANDKVLNHYRC